MVVRARKVEDSDHRSWPGSSTAEPVPPGGATTGLHFDIGPTAGAEKAALRSFNLRSRKQKRVHVEGPSITRVRRAPWLTTGCRLTRAPAPSCHNCAWRVKNARAKMAKSLFAEETGIVSPLIGSGPKNDWVYTPNRGALRCVPPAPLSRLAGYALAVDLGSCARSTTQRGLPAITSAKPYPGVKRDSEKLNLMEDYERRKCATSKE